LGTRRDDAGAVHLSAVGEIDMSNIAGFAGALETALSDAAVAGTADKVVVDLSEVEYLDSTGINALLPHAAQIEVIAHQLLLPVLRISGLSELTSVTPAQSNGR
jgi:anti-anti-sigma factor